MNKFATVLLCANFITVLFPQPGYIHPDEFFQSSEIVAGDVLGVQHFRTWEFNGTSAVRNIVFPYLVMFPSLYLLRWINSTGITEFQLSAVKVVMATRLPISFLSLLGYIATGRLADCFHINKYLSTVLYCSSYVTWTYYTRTFSNSIESVLLAVVLLLVLTFSGEETIAHQKNEMTPAEDIRYKSVSESTEREESATDEKGNESDMCRKTEKDCHKGDAQSENQKNTRLLSAAKEKQTVLKGSHPRKNVDGEKAHFDEAKTTEQENADTAERTEKDKPGKESGGEDSDTKKYKPKEVETKLRQRDIITELSILRAYIAKLVSFLLGAVITAGFFNRPTFLAFAVVPVLYWIWNATKCDNHKRWSGASIISIIFNLSLGAVFTFVTFILLDTLYFNPEILNVFSASWNACIDDHYSMHSVQTGLQAILSTLVVTPWNFLKYNSNSNNLAQHGIHPRFTHFLVNLPLLLGPLYIPFIICCIMSLYQVLRGSAKQANKNNLAWLCLMALVPVLSLSIFPHQEPRFLIPALPVLVVMGAKVVSAMTPGKLSFFTLWAVFNIFLTLVYGYMHQAALIPALSIYQQKLSSSSSHLSKNYHTIFYKTYSPPRHLLLLHPDNSQVSIHELAGAPIDTFLETVKQVQAVCNKSQVKCQVYVFLPSTVTPRVLERLPESNKLSTTSICPHFSMEAPPRLWAWWKKRLSFEEMIMDFCLNILTLA